MTDLPANYDFDRLAEPVEPPMDWWDCVCEAKDRLQAALYTQEPGLLDEAAEWIQRAKERKS